MKLIVKGLIGNLGYMKDSRPFAFSVPRHSPVWTTLILSCGVGSNSDARSALQRYVIKAALTGEFVAASTWHEHKACLVHPADVLTQMLCLRSNGLSSREMHRKVPRCHHL